MCVWCLCGPVLTKRACVYHMLIGQTLMECHTGENRVVSLFSYLQPFCVYAKQNVIGDEYTFEEANTMQLAFSSLFFLCVKMHLRSDWIKLKEFNSEILCQQCLR